MEHLKVLKRVVVDISNDNTQPIKLNIFRNDTAKFLSLLVKNNGDNLDVSNYEIKVDATVGNKVIAEITDSKTLYNKIDIPLTDISNVLNRVKVTAQLIDYDNDTQITLAVFDINIKSNGINEDSVFGGNNIKVKDIIKEIITARNEYPDLGARFDSIESWIADVEDEKGDTPSPSPTPDPEPTPTPTPKDESNRRKIYFKKTCDNWGTPRVYFYKHDFNYPDTDGYGGRFEAWQWSESPYMNDEGDGLYSYELLNGYNKVIFFDDNTDSTGYWQYKTEKLTIPPLALYKQPLFLQQSVGFNGIWGDYATGTLKLFVQDSYFEYDEPEYEVDDEGNTVYVDGEPSVLNWIHHGEEGYIDECSITVGDETFEPTFLGWIDNYGYSFGNGGSQSNRKYYMFELPIDITGDLTLHTTRKNRNKDHIPLSEPGWTGTYDVSSYGVTVISIGSGFERFDGCIDEGFLRYWVNADSNLYFARDIYKLQQLVQSNAVTYINDLSYFNNIYDKTVKNPDKLCFWAIADPNITGHITQGLDSRYRVIRIVNETHNYSQIIEIPALDLKYRRQRYSDYYNFDKIPSDLTETVDLYYFNIEQIREIHNRYLEQRADEYNININFGSRLIILYRDIDVTLRSGITAKLIYKNGRQTLDFGDFIIKSRNDVFNLSSMDYSENAILINLSDIFCDIKLSFTNIVQSINYRVYTNCVEKRRQYGDYSLEIYDSNGLIGDGYLESIGLRDYYFINQLEIQNNFCQRNYNLQRVNLEDGAPELENLNLRIKHSAFFDCHDLHQFPIQYVQSAESYAFWGCPLSQNVYLNNMESMGWQTFGNTSYIENIHIGSRCGIESCNFMYLPNVKYSVSYNNLNFCSDDYGIWNLDKSRLVKYSSGNNNPSFIFSNEVIIIDGYAFDCAYNLLTIDFSNLNSQCYINPFCILDCDNLETVILFNDFDVNDFSLDCSSNYSVDNIVSWFECLKDRTGEETYTLYIGYDNTQKLTEDQIAIATEKNWNII